MGNIPEVGKRLAELLHVRVVYCKGVFVAETHKRYPLTQARKLTGIAAPKRCNKRKKQSAWGDLAWVAKLNGVE